MDACEATNVLISKIKKIDSENAPKIMGYILLQGLSDTNLARLASSSEALLRNVVFKVKSHLGIAPPSFSAPANPSSPSPLNPISRPVNPFSQRTDSFVDPSRSSSWSFSNGSNDPLSPKASPFLSYDNIRSGSMVAPLAKGDSGHDFPEDYPLDEYLSFLDDGSSKNEEHGCVRNQMGVMMENGDSHLHRRRFSESDASSRVEDGGVPLGFRPCMYYARGFCKNGDSCKFVHSGFPADDGVDLLGNSSGSAITSPREIDSFLLQQHDDLVRLKVAQHHTNQRLAYDKYMNFLLQQREDPLRISEELQKLSRFRQDCSEFFSMGMADKSNSAARQIYLTFPADSAFRDEDVSNYFSTFGPVQDVRIPYQQKRMFGFVTFIHPETVKLILARGNPHFICDSRVLVKPYKEKGKLINEFNRRQQHLHQQLIERGSISPCSCPARVDPQELYDLHLEARMIQEAQELMLRRKLGEQAELQQAIELQGRRLVNLQLPDYALNHLHTSGGSSFAMHKPKNPVANISDDWNSQKLDLYDFERNSEQVLPDNLFGSSDVFPPLSGIKKVSHSSETNCSADDANTEKKPVLH